MTLNDISNPSEITEGQRRTYKESWSDENYIFGNYEYVVSWLVILYFVYEIRSGVHFSGTIVLSFAWLSSVYKFSLSRIDLSINNSNEPKE